MLLIEKQEEIEMFANRQAIAKLIKATEFLKERIENLSCEYRVDAIKEIDVYEPLEEGLDVVTVENLVPTL